MDEMNTKYLQESLNKSMILSEFVNVLDELTIRDSPISNRFNDLKLFAKEKFLELLKSKNLISDVPELELYRQKELPSGNNAYYEISSSTLRSKSDIDKADTFWTTDLIPNVVFTIKIGVDVNNLLSRPRQIKKGGTLNANQTEILHECFFAISITDQILHKRPRMGVQVVSIRTLNSFCTSLEPMLQEKNKIIKAVSDIDMHERFEPETLKRLHDAEHSATKVLSYLSNLYPNEKYKAVNRVFTPDVGGKKATADATIVLSGAGGKTISISLKYKKGQVNNISVKDVIHLLFGLNLENDNFLTALWKFDNNAVDQSLRSFIRLINSSFKFEGKIPETISYPDYVRSASSRKYALLYEKITDVPKKKEYFDSRKYMNSVTEKFLKQKSTSKSQEMDRENLAELVGYILRSEPNSSYIYVTDSGNTIYSVPSKSDLRKQNFSLKMSPIKDVVDFSRDVELKINGKPVIEFDLRFRWKRGQWVGDMAQVGRKFKINPYDWEK